MIMAYVDKEKMGDFIEIHIVTGTSSHNEITHRFIGTILAEQEPMLHNLKGLFTRPLNRRYNTCLSVELPILELTDILKLINILQQKGE